MGRVPAFGPYIECNRDITPLDLKASDHGRLQQDSGNVLGGTRTVKSLRNRQEVNEILSRLERLSPAMPHLWGKMSAHQMICHLNDAFKLYAGVITAAQPGFPYPSKFLKWGCLLVPIRWPKGFRTLPEVDQERCGTCPVEFEQDLAELNSRINSFIQIPESFAWPSHPYLGPMSTSEYMRLGYLHTDHHLRQFGV